jgi:heme exporter protein A
MLALQKLGFGFRHRPLFQDLSFTVAPGELVHLAGPNGAGKSTLMAVVAGLLEPTAGQVEYRPGKDSANPADDRRVFMEYLPAEANGLYVKMDATQNLEFWGRLRGKELAKVDIHAALRVWNLDHPLLRDDFPVEKFSTGMKRRLALARLALSPAPCWLLDEPLYGLDVEAMAIFTGMLDAHLKKGGLALVVSHDLKPLEKLITRTVTLKGGRE